MLFQPLALGSGERLPVIVGAVASRLIVTDCELVPPALLAVQIRVTPPVSESIVVSTQPSSIVTSDSGSVTVHSTETLLTYQPLLPSVPLMVYEISGGVVSGTGVGVGSGFTISMNSAGAVSHKLPSFPPVTLATLMV